MLSAAAYVNTSDLHAPVWSQVVLLHMVALIELKENWETLILFFRNRKKQSHFGS